ncbi:MAG: hypothetical protein AB7T10_09740 [bacterium]
MKKVFVSAVFGFLLISLLLTGCFFSISSDPDDITDWYTELPAGTVLTYSLRAYVNGNTQDYFTFTETVIKTELINGIKCTELLTQNDEGSSTHYILVDTEEGIIARSFDNVLDSGDDICFMTPVAIGTSWYDSYGTDEYEIKNIDSFSDVDAGKYYDIIVVEGGTEGGDWYELSHYSKSLNTFVFNRYDMILGDNTLSDHVELISVE